MASSQMMLSTRQCCTTCISKLQSATGSTSAKILIRRCQDKRSEPDKPYKVNAEQLECVALYVSELAVSFARRPDPSQPWVDPAEVLMTIIQDGGGGCGKPTLALDVLLPEVFFGPDGVLWRAPSNKPARFIAGRTMHSSSGLTTKITLCVRMR